MRHGWALMALIVGAVIGAGAALVAVEAPPPDATSARATQVAVVSTASAASEAEVALEPDLDDAALARHLEQAHFERDWMRAAAVERVLRERRARERRAREAIAAAPGAPAVDGRSLAVLDHDHRRVITARRFAERENAATRASREGTIGEREERLIALLTAQPASPADEVVRADAAEHLAKLERGRARQALQDALGDPDLRLVAARALARAGDPLATDALLGVLRDDLDPARRALAAQGLAESPGLVDGELVPAALARAAQADRDPLVRTHALATLARADLARFGGVRAALVALAEAEAEEAVVRQAVVACIRAHHALSVDTPPDLRDLVVRLLDATTGALRVEVIQALGELGDEAALPRLEAAIPAAPSADERDALQDALARVRLRRQQP